MALSLVVAWRHWFRYISIVDGASQARRRSVQAQLQKGDAIRCPRDMQVVSYGYVTATQTHSERVMECVRCTFGQSFVPGTVDDHYDAPWIKQLFKYRKSKKNMDGTSYLVIWHTNRIPFWNLFYVGISKIETKPVLFKILQCSSTVPGKGWSKRAMDTHHYFLWMSGCHVTAAHLQRIQRTSYATPTSQLTMPKRPSSRRRFRRCRRSTPIRTKIGVDTPQRLKRYTPRRMLHQPNTYR